MTKPASGDPRMFVRRVAVGQHIRSLREEAGLSQTALALLAGLERKAVQRVETATAVPTLERILEIADALGVRASDLLSVDPGPSRSRSARR